MVRLMFKRLLSVFIFFCVLSSVPLESGVNLLGNPGFEDPMPGPWVGFAGSSSGGEAVAIVLDNPFMPRSGEKHAELAIFDFDEAFAGVYQDVAGFEPGQLVRFSGWHKKAFDPLDITVEIRIEWLSGPMGVEIGKTENINDIPDDAYGEFSLTGKVPVGADKARAVYAIQTYAMDPTNSGIVYLDDMELVIVPEPTSLTVLALLGIVVGCSRRKIT